MKLFAILALTLFLSSCWKTDKPTEPRLLAQRSIPLTEIVPVYDSMYQWNVVKKQYIKVWGKAKDSVVNVNEYEVVPNGEQVMKYSKATGYNTLKIIGWLIVIVIGGLIAWAAGRFITFEKGETKLITRLVMIGLAIGVGFLTIRPGNIAQNNAKTITEKKLKHYQSIDPELNYFWDSVYNSGAILKN